MRNVMNIAITTSSLALAIVTMLPANHHHSLMQHSASCGIIYWTARRMRTMSLPGARRHGHQSAAIQLPLRANNSCWLSHVEQCGNRIDIRNVTA